VTTRLELTDIDWRRVSPKYVWVEFFRALVSTIVFVAIAVVFSLLHVWWLGGVGAVLAVISLVNLVLVRRRTRAIGYQLREDDLLFRRGIMWQRFVAVPYGRMQLVDINRGPLSRALGLSELKFVTAAAAAGVTIPGLPEAEADELRDRLVGLAESRRAGL
jgi:membrane protein YdbS with pleckstrin-like domain